MTIESSTMTKTASVVPTAAPTGSGVSASKALGGLLFIVAAALAGCGGGSDDPPAATPPAGTPDPNTPPAPAPGTPAPAPGTTVPAGMATGATLPNGGIVYYKDAPPANGTLDAGERAVVFNPITQHYYELVAEPANLSWDAASTKALALGGHLMTGDATGELEFVRTTFAYKAGQPAPAHGGLQVTEADGKLGAWIGLAAAPGPAPYVQGNLNSGDGVWSWVKPDGSPGGTALASGDAWIVHEAFVNGKGDDDAGLLRAAMTGGNDLAADTTPGVAPDPKESQCLYDMQSFETVVSRYIVEYENAAAIK